MIHQYIYQAGRYIYGDRKTRSVNTGNHVTGFFVCWPPPLVNVLTLSALRSGDARALDLSLAASHRA